MRFIIAFLFSFFIKQHGYGQIAIAGQTNSGLTYYDFSDVSIGCTAPLHATSIDSALLDYDQDGNIDFKISCSGSATLGNSSTAGKITAYSNTIKFILTTDPGPFNYPAAGIKPFALGDTIGLDSNSFLSSSHSGQLWSYASNPGVPARFGFWNNAGERYICFQSHQNGNVYIGWIRGEMISSNSSFTLKDMAIGSFAVSLEEQIKEQVKVFPNPIQDIVTIETKNQNPKTLEFCNLFGEVILRHSFSGKGSQVDTEMLEPGIYLLRIRSEGAESYHKLIKQ